MEEEEEEFIHYIGAGDYWWATIRKARFLRSAGVEWKHRCDCLVRYLCGWVGLRGCGSVCLSVCLSVCVRVSLSVPACLLAPVCLSVPVSTPRLQPVLITRSRPQLRDTSCHTRNQRGAHSDTANHNRLQVAQVTLQTRATAHP